MPKPECMICYERLRERTRPAFMPCEHDQFHDNCIRRWAKHNPTCPLCRKHIPGYTKPLNKKGDGRLYLEIINFFIVLLLLLCDDNPIHNHVSLGCELLDTIVAFFVIHLRLTRHICMPYTGCVYEMFDIKVLEEMLLSFSCQT